MFFLQSNKLTLLSNILLLCLLVDALVSPNILEEVFRYLATYFISATMLYFTPVTQTYIYLFVFGQKIIKIDHKVVTVKSRKSIQIRHLESDNKQI